MRKKIVLISVVILIVVSSVNVFAGGGKVRGDYGEGETNQEQIMGPWPFN